MIAFYNGLIYPARGPSRHNQLKQVVASLMGMSVALAILNTPALYRGIQGVGGLYYRIPKPLLGFSPVEESNLRKVGITGITSNQLFRVAVGIARYKK